MPFLRVRNRKIFYYLSDRGYQFLYVQYCNHQQQLIAAWFCEGPAGNQKIHLTICIYRFAFHRHWCRMGSKR